MDQCPSAVRAFNEEGQVIAMACDEWGCPVCGPLQAWRWSRRLRYGIALCPTRTAFFWTLTLPAWVETASTGYQILPGRWDRLRRSLHSALETWDYAAFVEEHPHRHFIPHFHVVSIQKAPYRLKDLAVQCGFGYQAKEVVINGGMAASYCAKYVSKQGRQMPRNFRRVRISQGWPRLPDPLYELAVYPQQRHESIPAYLSRVAVQTGCSPQVLRERWLDKGSTKS